jgi:hypothetical protein
VVIAGRTPLTDALEPLIAQAGFRPIHYDDPTGYVARLADDQPALILVGVGAGDWRFWVTTARVSPPTHRIPVVTVAPDDAARQEALAAGASFALTPADAAERLPGILGDHARRMDAAAAAQLGSDCEKSLPPDALEAIQTFNAGDYYHQHDLLEALWMREPGPARNLYQAILQVGIAYFQVTRGNRRGAHKMILRAQQWLSILPDVCQGVDVARLRADAMAVRAALEKLSDDEIGEFDRDLLRPVRMSAPGLHK